ncbi:MAG: hypothetical protein D6692_06430 [Planctomycetota bacterium]|nr:MAG: hypothetical protein D6692_06430 [Planctomycetota bacterium]
MDQNRPPARPGIRLTGTEQEEHDALAELFLGDAAFAPRPMSPADEPQPKPTSAPPSSRYEGSAVRSVRADSDSDHRAERPQIELVVLGHLPVRASLWVRQYACQAARKRGETVSLVRTSGGSVAVDVITGVQRAEVEPVESIEDAIAVAMAAASRVILRVDETAEPELLERGGIDEVTILTGADEAAVVASYRLIKSLAASLDDRLDSDEPPRLRVAVMGGSGEVIAQACKKIERACKAFLDRPVEVLDASGRIDATGTTTICRIDEDHAADRAIEALLDTQSEAPFAPVSLRLTDEEADRPAMPEVVVRPIGAPRSDPTPAVTRGDSLPLVEPKPTNRRLREPLPELIEGLSTIQARCPYAPGVELACDAEGDLHAVTTDDGPDAVARLLAAGAWAMDNLPLLIRAETSVRLPASDPMADCGVTLHLLARSPARHRAVLDTDIRLYALASVEVDGEEIMVATPINT